MPRTVTPDLSLVLMFLRLSQGWSQAGLGEISGISSNLLNEYERGGRTSPASGWSTSSLSWGCLPRGSSQALAALAANRVLRTDAGGLIGRRSVHVPADGGPRRPLRDRDDRRRPPGPLACSRSRGRRSMARQRAGFLWDRLRKRAPAERRALVQQRLPYLTWALCERVAAESIRKAPNHPKEALELAELALLIAERVPGETTWSLRLQGYAWAHVSNARRVCNDLPGAEEAIVPCQEALGGRGAGRSGVVESSLAALDRGGSPPRSAAIPGGPEADRRGFGARLRRVERKILLTKARIHEILGDPEASTAALLEAAPLIDPAESREIAFGVRFNLAGGSLPTGAIRGSRAEVARGASAGRAAGRGAGSDARPLAGRESRRRARADRRGASDFRAGAAGVQRSAS